MRVLNHSEGDERDITWDPWLPALPFARGLVFDFPESILLSAVHMRARTRL